MYESSRDFGASSTQTSASDAAIERRQRIAAELAAAIERKHRDLMRQTAMESSPETRIELWERRHGMSLPRDPAHPVLPFVATSTNLLLEQVLTEQRRRAGLHAGS
jgi:hypothetical protein